MLTFKFTAGAEGQSEGQMCSGICKSDLMVKKKTSALNTAQHAELKLACAPSGLASKLLNLKAKKRAEGHSGVRVV